jgi:hypothetical protein
VIVILLSLTILGIVQAGVNEWTAIGPEGADIAAVVLVDYSRRRRRRLA